MFFSFQTCDYCISWYGFLWVYAVWGWLSFLNIWVYVFCQMWEIFGCYFFRYFISSTLSCLAGILMAQALDLLLQSHMTLSLHSFFFQPIFSLFRLGNFYCTVFKIIDSLLHLSHSATSPSTELFMMVILLFYDGCCNFHLDLYTSVPLLKLSMFSFVSSVFVIAH